MDLCGRYIGAQCHKQSSSPPPPQPGLFTVKERGNNGWPSWRRLLCGNARDQLFAAAEVLRQSCTVDSWSTCGRPSGEGLWLKVGGGCLLVLAEVPQGRGLSAATACRKVLGAGPDVTSC